MKIQLMMIVLSLLFAVRAEVDTIAQSDLEGILQYGFPIEDNFVAEAQPEPIPLRYHDCIPEFRDFLARHQWSTNQLVDGLILAVTNRMSDSRWSQEKSRRIIRNAVWKLSEINSPAVTNFIRQAMETGLRGEERHLLLPVFQYSFLEPETLGYLRTLCVKTNTYDSFAINVSSGLLDTLSTMPDELKPAATNRVANYLYFSIMHTTQDIAYQDRVLARFLPAYSNSLERLEAMEYVVGTATNVRQRVRAQMEIERLMAIGTNNLNRIAWIAEP